MKFGHFDNTSGEYVITRPDTPRPWSNYLGSADFGGVITNHGAGYTFYKSAAQGRLTRFQFNALPAEWKGRVIYLRDAEDGAFWSHAWLPVAPPLEEFATECRHGTGYTKITSTCRGIRSEVTSFIPLGATYEVWQTRITNTGTQTRQLQIFPFLEPQCNWNADDDTRNLQYTQYITSTRWVEGVLEIISNINMPADPQNFTNKDQRRSRFFSVAGQPVSGHDGDLTAFMGPYGNTSRPAAVVAGRCANSDAYGDMPAAALEIHLALAPGESTEFAVVFGIGEAEQAAEAMKAVATPAGTDALLGDVKTYWRERLETLRVESPDEAFDSMVNLWAPYNNLMTFYWSRTASLVYAGERDGLGFRDTLQDIVGAAALVTEDACQRLELLLTGQYAHGGCKPVVQPFNHRPGAEAPPDHLRADDGMWFFNAVPAYVQETGDLDFFHKVLPFADAGEATVLGHLRRAIEFNLERSGTHGLPCGLHADWNDCIRLGERGESIFVAMQVRYALREYRKIALLLAEEVEAAWAEAQLADFDQRLEQHAWDGEWYLRAYRFDGLKFGSQECDEGRIFMNPQVWAVMSGAATGARAEQILNAMHRHLATEYGILLCAPPYVSTDPQVCLARLFNPGTKENGGVFNHTQGWAVMAAAELGHGDRAYEYMTNVMPSRFNEIAEIRQVEPYAVCQSTHGAGSPRHGTGRLSWLSGSAVWNYVAMTTAILGIKPDYHGLRLDPCIPAKWPGFSVTRRFRGATYHIQVENPEGRQKGIRSLVVDGQHIKGTIIPPAAPGAEVRVVARM